MSNKNRPTNLSQVVEDYDKGLVDNETMRIAYETALDYCPNPVVWQPDCEKCQYNGKADPDFYPLRAV